MSEGPKFDAGAFAARLKRFQDSWTVSTASTSYSGVIFASEGMSGACRVALCRSAPRMGRHGICRGGAQAEKRGGGGARSVWSGAVRAARRSPLAMEWACCRDRLHNHSASGPWQCVGGAQEEPRTPLCTLLSVQWGPDTFPLTPHSLPIHAHPYTAHPPLHTHTHTHTRPTSPPHAQTLRSPIPPVGPARYRVEGRRRRGRAGG